MYEETKNTVLIVDDEAANINTLVHLLWMDYTLYVAKDGPTAIEMARTHIPDLILLDIVMPGMDGYQILAELREFRTTQNIPVIFVSGLSSHEDEEKGLSLEVADYITKPFTPTIVKLRIHNQIRIINYMRIIERLSMTDSLTGLHNRRSFNERLKQEWGRALREEVPLSLIMLDVDNFKNYNDTYGHQQGDVVLRTVSGVFSDSVKRSTDFIARWGGEEFVILMPATGVEGAVKLAEEIRLKVENTIIVLSDGTPTKVTVSAGVNELIPSQTCMMDKFISDADKAMYEAKEKGRNTIVSACTTVERRTVLSHG